MNAAVDFLPPNPGELPRGADCGAGLLVVDKPQGLTSNQVLSRVRRIAGQKKVGYAGTLDPMATGLLIFALGKATKLLQYLGSSDKAYVARVRFGVSTDTDDAAGTVVGAAGAGGLTGSVLADSLGAYRGAIHQVPSSFSAIKVAGQRAYALARQGQDVKLKSRPVTISRLELESGLAAHEIDVSIGRAAQETTPRNPGGENLGATGGGAALAAADGGRVAVADVDIAVECSAGTYIRALARDLGRDLGTGAHLTALRRTRVGNYGLEAARNLAELGEEVATQGIISIIPLDAAVKALFPTLELDETQARALGYGQTVTLPSPPPALYDNNQPLAAALDEAGQVIALVTLRVGDTAIRVKPTWVLRPAVAAS
ncbi:tRNA pseudouridine(55) synthase TruB [Mobiluncus mulieris]|uniref:tRNA pseudouridine(55) synthase TruB n=1 Tax=Mobiluncus mulieris TaxID=2052 RepID=UPI00146FE8A3|nr:tRNA pseudouridine(55) synthase TruB [Mobiluncus mulieris]NMX12059.1 tRNA pseudouridine(55) synthase TruB [Mobiluncus mulieris]